MKKVRRYHLTSRNHASLPRSHVFYHTLEILFSEQEIVYPHLEIMYLPELENLTSEIDEIISEKKDLKEKDLIQS